MWRKIGYPTIFSKPAPDPVFGYFDFPIYHVETGSGSGPSIPSLVGIRLRPVAARNPKPAPEKSESATTLTFIFHGDKKVYVKRLFNPNEVLICTSEKNAIQIWLNSKGATEFLRSNYVK